MSAPFRQDFKNIFFESEQYAVKLYWFVVRLP
jgi:hypothetical protein